MTRSSGRPHERILGLDVGSRRVGVAISDELGVVASPVEAVERGRNEVERFRDIARRYGASRIVAGLPTGMSGREGPQAAEVRTYADALAAQLDLPLDYWDERLTTTVAERALIASGVRRERRKQQIDAVAAAVMLQGYLDAQAAKERRRRGP